LATGFATSDHVRVVGEKKKKRRPSKWGEQGVGGKKRIRRPLRKNKGRCKTSTWDERCKSRSARKLKTYTERKDRIENSKKLKNKGRD